MDIIRFENWKTSEADPRRREYAGQRTAQEVFAELKDRLEGMGCLPEEFFLAPDWTEGEKIPKEADVFCSTNYGSEGVCVDVRLKWYEDNKAVFKTLATGKALGESGDDLDRMHLVSSAITKAFHGEHGTHARYMKVGGQDKPRGEVLYLSQKEQRTLTDTLKAQLEQLGQQGQDTTAVEQLLRRMTGGGITSQGPDLHISDYDKARLAIRDGNLDAFKESLAKVPGRADDLLVEAAGRPGTVGTDLTVAALSDRKDIAYGAYCAACKKAIDIGDMEKSLFLLYWAEHAVDQLEPSFHGEMIQHSYWDHPAIAKAMIGTCSPEQISAAPSSLLEIVLMHPDYRTARELVEKGISGGENSWRILHTLTCNDHNSWMAESLLQQRMWVDVDDYYAMRSCIENDAVDAAKQLLRNGMDFEKFQTWAEKNYWGGSPETLQALSDCWQELKASRQEESPEQEGMRFV